MNFNDILSNMQDMAADLEAVRKKYQTEMQEKFTLVTQKFFEAAPNVQAVVWSQYTPYFNDGSECTFSVNTPVFITKNFDPDNLENPYEYEDDDTYGSESFWYLSSLEKSNFPNKKVCYEFSKLIESEDELMKSVFRDHIAVYLTKDAVYTQEYDHD